MDPFTMMMLMQGGQTLLSGLFGGKKEKMGYEMSPHEKGLLGTLNREYGGETPGYVTGPIYRQSAKTRKSLKQHYARQPGSSGILGGQLMKESAQTGTLASEASGRHKQGLLSSILALVKGGGTRTASSGAPWGEIIGGGAEDMGFLWALKQMMKGKGQGQGVMA